MALSDCDILCSINFSSVLSFHLQHDADITIVYRHGRIPLDMADPAVYTVRPGRPDSGYADFAADRRRMRLRHERFADPPRVADVPGG